MRKFLSLIIILALCLCLSACGSMNMGGAAVNSYLAGNAPAAESNIHNANLIAAEAWSKVGCHIPYDAVAKGDQRTAAAIIELCGPPAGYLVVKSNGTSIAISQPAQ